MEEVKHSFAQDFEFLAVNAAATLDASVVIAASRAGATGVLSLAGCSDAAEARKAMARVGRQAPGKFGYQFDTGSDLTRDLINEVPAGAEVIVFTADRLDGLEELIRLTRGKARRVLLAVTSEQEAAVGAALHVDGLIAKGNEAGGRVGEETAFVLLQRLAAETELPVWAQGGVGLHSVAACYAAGAAGVVLDSQLLLVSESSIPAKVRTVLSRMEAEETLCLGREMGSLYRVYRRHGAAAADELAALEYKLAGLDSRQEAAQRWDSELRKRTGWGDLETDVWPVGQDAAFAARLAKRYQNVAGVLGAMWASLHEHVRGATNALPLDRGSALAREHGTEFPILQGPMTRVSDRAAFAAAVGEGGGLPFLALALLPAPLVRNLLAETQSAMGGRPWGIGILGFVPAELRAKQLEVVHEYKPPFAIIAGGRPDQAKQLEEAGIPTYLHVPVPSLLRMFLHEGARRFIFEGRECGGHVGPRSSFVLWETMVETLLEEIDGGVRAEELSVVFAGGIHDARSSAMVAALAAVLAEKGAKIGVLLGTSYLFTEEAVRTGAIVEGFQEEALQCRDTVVVETSPGHAIRCVPTPFYEAFCQLKRKLLGEGRSGDETRDTLERFNLGRLRIASKGVAWLSRQGDPETEAEWVEKEQQHNEGFYMIGQVAALKKATCTIRQLHEEVSCGGSSLLRGLRIPANRRTVRGGASQDKPCDVAIVGMACMLPKAPDVRTFWANVLNRVDAITEVPADRFDVDIYFNKDRKAKDKMYSRWGGFLEAVAFDPMRYGIPPAALRSIDPMQLLALLAVEQALRDAGYDKRPFTRERTSVILGLSGGLGDLGLDYAVRASLPQLFEKPPAGVLDQLPDWTEDSFAGLLLNVTAGRVANRFDFGGVNFTVDAACASSLAAVYLATRELTSGSSDMVVVGGVDTAQSPFGFQCFSSAQALSPSGRCRTLDESADGIAISEGLVCLVLKRLADAERDGDCIYAVIKGIAGSSDGRGRSMTAPRPEGQQLVLQRAYTQAGIRPSTVSLIEAHGTGTVAGDAAELEALSKVFRADGARAQSCAIGSVKSMIGHTKSAAGVAGVLKVALALHHKVQPPTLHVTRPNSKLQQPESPFYVNVEAQPWTVTADAVPRRAGVSSFGFGGTNFHAVLEEYPGDLRPASERHGVEDWPAEVFLWKSTSAAALKAELAETQALLESAAERRLRELAASVCRRTIGAKGDVRLAIVASSREELRERLSAALGAIGAGKNRFQDGKGVHLGYGPVPGKVAFLYSGQGSQHPWMLRDLAVAFPEFKESLEESDRVLSGNFPTTLSSYIYPPPAFSPEEERQRMQEITDTVVAQPALGAVEVALSRLLERLGIKPEMTAGHSYGEYAALWAAGAMSAETLFRLSEARGRIIKESTGAAAGTMAAVQADAGTVAGALDGAAEVWIANLNAPRQTIIAGSTSGVEGAIGLLDQRKLTAKKIPVACAFHSPLMQPARDRLAAVLGQTQFTRPSVDVFSNTTAEKYPESPKEISALLADHLVRPVRFVDEVQAMYEQGARIFVEVGPKSVLAGLARQILDGKDAIILAVDTTERRGLTQLAQVIGQLHALGLEIDVEQVFGRRMLEQAEPAGAPQGAGLRTGWKVNGKCVFAQAEKPVAKKPVPLAAAVAQPPVPAPPAPTFAPPPAPAGFNSEALDAVMMRHQQLMQQFLESQSSIMASYLGGSPAQPGVPAPMPAVSLPAPAPLPQAAPPPQPAPEAAVSTPEPAPAKAPEQKAPAVRDWLGEIQKIVSERTGYPTEMLDMNAAIEADLGIDSIKRVEILSTFQRTLSAAEQTKVQGIMETLTQARSLREIGERLLAALGGAESAAVQAPVAEPATRDHLADLQKIVSERTGYPPEMLDLNAAIEADLGIDSIKRVEILSTFQRSLSASEQAKVQGIMETLTQARSLRQMGEGIAAALGEESGGKVEVAEADAVPRYGLTAVPKPREKGKRHFPGRVCLVTDDETGVAAGLAEAWTRAGERVVLLRHSPGAVIGVDGVYSADLTDPAAVEAVIAAIRRQYESIGALIHLLPLRESVPAAPAGLDEWRAQLRLDLVSLYALTRFTAEDLLRTGRDGGALLAAATSRGGEFGLDGKGCAAASQFAVADFMKTAAQEFPGVLTKVVDLDPSDPVTILHHKLTDELSSEDATLEVGLPGDRRLTVLPKAAPLNGNRSRAISGDWVFLLTGGARGITAEIAKSLAQRYRPTLILAGSSPNPPGEDPPEIAAIRDPLELKKALRVRLSAKSSSVKPAEVEAAYNRCLRDREIRTNLAAMRAHGARVEYHSLDVKDEAGFSAFVERIYKEHGRLDVVIHGAGVIEDKLISQKQPESFERVLHTKADSALILSKTLRFESLQSLIFMSSISSVFGNRGQSDYAAANGTMNGLAAQLAVKWPGRVVAICWGPWDAVGMASEGVRKQLLSRGIQPIAPAEGVEAAIQEIEAGAAGEPVVVIGAGPWDKHAVTGKVAEAMRTST